MTSLEIKGDLHSYLQGARESSVWKLDRLGEYDIRRPLTPTGTNLLGLVKHSAGTQPLGRPPQGHGNVPSGDLVWWAGYRDRVEAAARLASGS